MTFADEASGVGRAASVADMGTGALRRIGRRSFVLPVVPGTVGDVVRRLEGRSGVVAAEPDYFVRLAGTPNDASFSTQWALRNTGQAVQGEAGTPDADIDADAAWSVTTGSSQVVVAVLDSGVDGSHPDLAPNMWRNPGVGGCPAGTFGADFVNGDCDPHDDNGHGTHVAGTIGAVGNNSRGVAGVAWNVRIMALKVLDSTGSGPLSDILAALYWAVDAKLAGVPLRVINASLGGRYPSQAEAEAYAWAAQNDILVVAAAGNDGANNDVTPQYPCGFPAVVCVANTTNDDILHTTSNYGRYNVEVAAPGTAVYSTVPGGGYAYETGTSMAAPHVSGTAALVLSREALSAAALRTRLLSAIDLVPSLAGRVATGGRLNVCKAISGCSAAPGTIERVSMSSAGEQRNKLPAGSTTSCSALTVGKCSKRTISQDGNAVVFASRAPNLVSVDNNNASDIYLWRRDTTVTPPTITLTRVSEAAGGGDANGDSETPTISPNGQWVAFESTATNLVAGDGNNSADVFVWSQATGLILASKADSTTSTPDAQGNLQSFAPSVADNGTVAFTSFANNLVGPGKTSQ
ncbi:MAG: S8 family serine peptidase, partial [Acidimicrobiia bacterium]